MTSHKPNTPTILALVWDNVDVRVNAAAQTTQADRADHLVRTGTGKELLLLGSSSLSAVSVQMG